MSHAKLAPSSSERWLACPGSVKLCEAAPPSVSSFHADEGTLAHALASYCIQNDLDPQELLGAKFEDDLPVPADEGELQVTEEMCDAVGVYLGHVQVHIRAFGPDNWCVEKKLRPSQNPIHQQCTGTADFVAVSPDRTLLVVCDYKHGAGIVVEAEGNTQLLIYGALAASVMAGPKLKTVMLEIVQPRARRRDEAVSRWVLPVAEFQARVQEISEGAKATEIPGAPVLAGTHCRWCPAKTICSALQEKAIEVARQDFAAPPPQEKAPIPDDPQRLAYILQHEEMVKGWLEACRQRALELAHKGTTIPGYKLVRGSKNRRFIDEAKALEVFGKRYGKANVCIEKLMPMGQLEKWLKRTLEGRKLQNAMELFGEHVEKPVGELALAIESDPRPAESPSLPGEEIEFLLG